MPTTLVEGLSNYVVRSATEFKAVYTRVGSLASLNTTAKGSVVEAINEVNSKPSGSGGANINDAAPSTTTVYSSSKVESYVTNAVSAKATINDTVASTSTAYSGTKVEALVAALAGARPVINDAAPSGTAVYSSTKVESFVNAAVANLVDTAPENLNTLRELADAIGNNQTVSDGFATALGVRVAVDAPQSFTAGQQAQGRSNIGAQSAAEIGDVSYDFVALFNANL